MKLYKQTHLLCRLFQVYSPTWLFWLVGLNLALKQSLSFISAFLLSKVIFFGVNEASTDTSAMLCDLKDQCLKKIILRKLPRKTSQHLVGMWPQNSINLAWQTDREVAQLCPTLCDPVDYSPPGSSIHGILQARVLEWVAISFSRDLPDPGIEPRSPTLQADAL